MSNLHPVNNPLSRVDDDVDGNRSADNNVDQKQPWSTAVHFTWYNSENSLNQH